MTFRGLLAKMKSDKILRLCFTEPTMPRILIGDRKYPIIDVMHTEDDSPEVFVTFVADDKGELEKCLEMIRTLSDLVDDAHDTHIWSDDDEHPKQGCVYCRTVNDARSLLKRMGKEE